MSIVLVVCAAMLTLAAGLVLLQIERGPSPLDRMVGVDVMTAILLGGLALLAARTHRTDLLVVFVVVSVAGFLGAVAVARFGRGRELADLPVVEVDDDGGIDAHDGRDDAGGSLGGREGEREGPGGASRASAALAGKARAGEAREGEAHRGPRPEATVSKGTATKATVRKSTTSSSAADDGTQKGRDRT